MPVMKPLLVSLSAVVMMLSAAAAVGGAEQASPVHVLTLERAVELALERSPGLRAARNDYEAAGWGLWSARASLLPSLGFSSAATRVDPDTYERANASLAFAEEYGMDIEPFLYETTYETGFYATVPIWNGGRLWGAAGVAAAARDAALHGFESRRRAVTVGAKSAYFDVLRTEALVEVQHDAVYASARRADTAERSHELGLASRAELLRWRLQLAEDERALAEAERVAELSRTALRTVLGLPLDARFELTDVGREELHRQLESLAWLRDAPPVSEQLALELLSDNPDFLGLEASTRMSRSGVTIARGAFLPTLNATGRYGWKADDDIDPDDETTWSVTVALDLPVFTSFKNLADYQSSRKTLLAAVNRQEEGQRGLIAALRNAVATVRSSLKALAAADTAEEQAEEFFETVSHRREQGMASYTELVDARVLHDRGRVGAVNALYDCLVALADAERILGPHVTEPSGDEP